MADYLNSPDMATTNGLDPNGWWPGKKHSWKERLGQVATLGVWNPDDRTSSDNNKMQLKSRAGSNEVLYQMTQNLIKVGIEPQEAAKMANNVFASKYQSDIAANEAAAAESGNRKGVAEGYQPHTRTIGMNRGAQDAAAADAGTVLNQNMANEARAESKFNVPEVKASETLGQLQSAGMGRRLADDRLVQEDRDRKALREKTFMPTLEKAGIEAVEARDAAERKANFARDPALAERLMQAEVNKQTAIPTPYGGSVQNILFPKAGEEVMGPERLAPGTGALNGYTVSEEKRDPVTGQTYILNKTRTPMGAPAPILAPQPGAQNPQVTPNLPEAPGATNRFAKPVRIIGN